MSGAIYPDLENRSVLVTGGGSGIGEAIVRAFARQKSKIGFIDINAEASEKLAGELRRDTPCISSLRPDRYRGVARERDEDPPGAWAGHRARATMPPMTSATRPRRSPPNIGTGASPSTSSISSSPRKPSCPT